MIYQIKHNEGSRA